MYYPYELLMVIILFIFLFLNFQEVSYVLKNYLYYFSGTRLVPVTPIRSQIKQNDSEKVPIINSRIKSNSSIPGKLSTTKNSRLKATSPGGGCDTISLLFPKTETSSMMSSLSDCQVFDSNDSVLC